MSPSKRLEAPGQGVTPGDPSWRLRAACRGMDINTFFPYRGTFGEERAQAIEVCTDCPVRMECLEEGLTVHTASGRLMDGIWGGFGKTEREVMIGTRRAGKQYERTAPRLRRVLQDQSDVVSLLGRYRRGELSGQGEPPPHSAA